MKVHLALLWSDILLLLFYVAVMVFFVWARRRPYWRAAFRRMVHSSWGMVGGVLLILYFSVAMLDSIRLDVTWSQAEGQVPKTQVVSVFDLLVSPLGMVDEVTYSSPFATHLYGKRDVLAKKNQLVISSSGHRASAWLLFLKGLGWGLFSGVVCYSLVTWVVGRRHRCGFLAYHRRIWSGQTWVAWRSMWLTLGIVWVTSTVIMSYVGVYHVMGTDKVGHDIFYETLKSIRTGVFLGTVTTLLMLPFAVILGLMAGFFRGWIDDVIQYIYTTLSSIPGVLLISAAILVLQLFISRHVSWFPSLAARADARLLALCLILGLTGWAGLCRLVRGETLKLREQEFVQAARGMGVGGVRILGRHIFPNVLHIIVITLVLDFSGLVLAEAVLSFVGVGVDPTTMSWGHMINGARLEMAREPLVWWPLMSALIVMFGLVFAANVFADSVRDALDPRLSNSME